MLDGAKCNGRRAASESCATPSREAAALLWSVQLLDRYIAADPEGYVNLYAQDVTYFDPTAERRVDGLAAMQERSGTNRQQLCVASANP